MPTLRRSARAGTPEAAVPRRRRWVRWGLGIVVVVGIGLVAVWPYGSARGELLRGRDALVRAQDLLLAGDVSGADAAFREADQAFTHVSGGAGHLILRAEGFVPFLGRTPSAIVTLTEVGREVAEAGQTVTGSVLRLPSGLKTLALQGGRLNLDAFASLGRAVHEAHVQLQHAKTLADGLPGSLVLGPVAAARDLLREKLNHVLRVVQNTDYFLQALPSFAGADVTRRYFVAAQNPAELRGTGGYIGEYAILTARRGLLSLSPFLNADGLRGLPVSSVPAPSLDFAEMYNRFGGAGFWPNINMTPDAPTAGTLIEDLFRRAEHTRLDGTIFLVPQSLADMLGATGPVRAPSLGATLTARNVVPFVTNQLYFRQAHRGLRKRTLGIAASDVWAAFLGRAAPASAMQSLAQAAALGHIVIHAADPVVQADLQRVGLTGNLGTDSGDFLGVFLSSADATKVDYYLREHLAYDVTLRSDGGASAAAEIQLRNGVEHPIPGTEVFGPARNTGLAAGESQSLLSVYCAVGCQLATASIDGGPTQIEHHTELGLPLFARYVRILPGRGRSLSFAFQNGGAWTTTDGGGVYRVRIQAQATIVPVSAVVRIHVPAGMHIQSASPSMQVQNGVATWEGIVRGSRPIEVRFRS